MRHYEIVLLTHPNYEEQIQPMLDGYKSLITTGGHLHRFEDWGRLSLAHSIKKQSKAHYFLLNLECDQENILELERRFRFNDAILRFLITHLKNAQTEESAFLKQQNKQRTAAPVHINNPMYSRMDDTPELVKRELSVNDATPS